MGYIEEATRDLYGYKPELTKQPDFDEFWERTLAETRSAPLNPVRSRIDYPSRHVEVYDIAYDGVDGTPIHGWYIVPSFLGRKKVPCLVHYHGFTGHRGQPSDLLNWALMGFAIVSVDCRDQGGSTGNLAGYTGGFSTNVACKGILNKDEYYYRSVYTDCIRAIDFACGQPEVDTDKLVIEGGSQGGGIGMAVAALDPRAKLALVDVPSNSNLVKRIEGNHGAFASVGDYLKKQPQHTDLAFATLSYFDTMNLADRIKCKVFASVALKDETCPPLMYFATYNRIGSEKEIAIYPFNGHEGGGSIQTEAKMACVMRWFPEWFE